MTTAEEIGGCWEHKKGDKQINKGCTHCKVIIDQTNNIRVSQINKMKHPQMVNYDVVERLQGELMEYKRLLWSVKEENVALKSKMRRLEENFRKKTKILDSHFMAPNNKLLSKELTSQSTYTISKLEESNEDLKQKLLEKDASIRCLKKKLEMYSAYLNKGPSTRKIHSAKSFTSETVIKITNDFPETARSSQESHSSQTSGSTTDSAGNKCIKYVTPSSSYSSKCIVIKKEETGNEKGAPQLEKHQEIEKLHQSFNGIADEVNKLREAVQVIQQQHANNVFSLKEKGKRLETVNKIIKEKTWDAEEAVYQSINKISEAATARKNTPALKSHNMSYISRSPSKYYPPMKIVAEVIKQKALVKRRRHSNKKQNANVITTKSQTVIDENEIDYYIDDVIKHLNRGDL